MAMQTTKQSHKFLEIGLTARGERELLLDFWEREREWLNPFPNFGNGNEKLHSQLLGMGTGMKIPFPIFGNGNGNGNSIPNFGNGNETLLFPGMTGNGNAIHVPGMASQN